MRKILMFTRNGIATLQVVCRSVSLAAFGASLTVTTCGSSAAYAQVTYAQQLAPAAMTSNQDTPVSGALANHGAVDASYSIVSDRTSIQPAAYNPATHPFGPGHPSSNPCDPGCDLSYYVNFDAVYMRRERDERFSLSRNSTIEDFEFELGGRFTAGRLLDCTNAWEISYLGPFDWERRGTTPVSAGAYQSRLLARDGYTDSEISTFNDADQHSQAYRAQLNSFELNRRWWSWDVISTMIGIRYVDYEEDYVFLSTSGAGTGRYTESVDNQMLGAQVGADIFYPVSLRTNVGFRGKAGAYANFAERGTFLRNANVIVLESGDSHTDLAGVIEMGVFSSYQLVPSIRLTAAYDFWYLPGMATVPEQSPNIISPASGGTVFNEDNLFLHGASLGVQVLY
jgi:hypothetical protein